MSAFFPYAPTQGKVGCIESRSFGDLTADKRKSSAASNGHRSSAFLAQRRSPVLLSYALRKTAPTLEQLADRNMDTSQMIAREFENLPLEARRGPTSAFDMNMSLLSNTALSYPIAYGPANIAYTTGPGSAASMASYGSILPPQTLYLPSSYAINQNISQVRHIPGASIQFSSGSLVKAETKPSEDETYMYYDVSLPPAHGPKNPGEVNFGTDVDTLMRAIQVKSESRRRGPRISEIHEPSERRLSDGPEPDIARDAYNESGPGFPRSRKKYQCSVPSCSKVFFQKTHLEIHVRAHTGAKPFVSDPGALYYRISSY